MRNIVLSPNAFEHYQYWLKTDLAVVDKINQLLRECQRTLFTESIFDFANLLNHGRK